MRICVQITYGIPLSLMVFKIYLGYFSKSVYMDLLYSRETLCVLWYRNCCFMFNCKNLKLRSTKHFPPYICQLRNSFLCFLHEIISNNIKIMSSWRNFHLVCTRYVNSSDGGHLWKKKVFFFDVCNKVIHGLSLKKCTLSSYSGYKTFHTLVLNPQISISACLRTMFIILTLILRHMIQADCTDKRGD
jgi:hypothetical protein